MKGIEGSDGVWNSPGRHLETDSLKKPNGAACFGWARGRNSGTGHVWLGTDVDA